MDCLSRTPSPISRGYQAQRSQMARPFPSVTIFLARRSLPGFFSMSATILKLMKGQPLARMPEATALASDRAPVHLSARIIRTLLWPEAGPAMAATELPALPVPRGALFPAHRCWTPIIWAVVAEPAPALVGRAAASFVSRLVGFCAW